MSLLWRGATASTKHIPMESLPVHPEPHGISDEDVPAEYARTSRYWADHFGGTYSLHHIKD